MLQSCIGTATEAAVEELQVLLVEDDPDHEELIRRAFEQRAPRIALRVLRHGEEALDYLFRRGAWAGAEAGPRPHLILLDLRLPRVDGFQVLSEVKDSEALRVIPTVVLTTSESEHDMARAYAHHANSYLVKPVEFTRFVELIRTVENYWLELNRQPGDRARPPE
jgi:CheY-like chemotaxis protein